MIGASGDLGFGLALRWAAAGVPVTIGSRDAGRAEEAAARVRAALPDADVEGLANPEAAARGPLVVLCVPFAAQLSTLASLKDSLREEVLLVDCTVPLATAVGGRPTQALGVPAGSAAQQAQKLLGEAATVVAALHTVSAATLTEPGHELGEDVFVCGRRKADKARVAALVECIPGLRAVNAGDLEAAHLVEQLTPLLISINGRYKTHAGLRVVGLPGEDHWGGK